MNIALLPCVLACSATVKDVRFFKLGGNVSGLVGTVVLGNGAVQLPVSANGAFTFAGNVDDKVSFAVEVRTQPENQTCTVANGTGYIATADVTNVAVTCATNEPIDATTYTVGGNVTGLSGTLVVQDNGGDNLSLTADGAFTFATALASDAAYAVTVLTQPAAKTCTVTHGTGTVATQKITNVTVTCVPGAAPTFSVGGTIQGLYGSVTVQNNAGDDLTLSASGLFTFSTAVSRGATYAVTVSSQPNTQVCKVTNGFGTMAAAKVTNVAITCDVAVLRPDKALSNFALFGSTLPVSIEHSVSAKIGNKIYIIGGSLGAVPDPIPLGLTAGTTAAIFEATVANDGTPGAFAKSSFALTTPRQGARLEVIGSYVYVIGGYPDSAGSSNTPFDSIERAGIDSNGLTSTFSTYASTLARGRYNFLTLVTTGFIYAIGGGIDTSINSDTMERATISVTGEIGNFQALTRNAVSATEVTNGLVDSRWTHNGIRLGDNFYILGGESLDTIEKVVINSDGSLGNFVKPTATLPQARNRLSIVALHGKAFVFGGWNGGFLTTVESASIANDELGAFTTEASITLPTGVENGVSLLTDSAVFLFGGTDGTEKAIIQYAPLVAP